MRMSVWDKPRVIGCAENYPRHIALPRGCLDAALELLRDNGITCDLSDERFAGEAINVAFTGVLRLDQEIAVSTMLHHDVGVLSAPTAFGKTVTAAAMIARREVNTLVLVHRTELLKQWQERLQTFLGVNKEVIGCIAAGCPTHLVGNRQIGREGFDHPPLDTLILAMPVSWRGTLQQYAGRLHRDHAGKTNVRIIDFVDSGHPALLRMWDKRLRGYRAMGYRIGNSCGSIDLTSSITKG